MRTEFFMHDPSPAPLRIATTGCCPRAAPEHTAASLADVADLLARTVPCVRVLVTDSPAALARRVTALLDEQPTTTVSSKDPR